MYRSLVALILPALALLSLAASPRPAAAYQQCANVLISAPRSGSTVRGDVEVFGSASIDRFQFYKVEFSPLANPDAWAATSQVIRRPILNGRLDVWNSRAVPDGLYNLKLTVVDDRAQEVCRAVVTQVQVANRAPVATDTPPFTPTPVDTPTPNAPTATNTVPSLPTQAVSPTVTPGPSPTSALPTIPSPPTQAPTLALLAVAQPTAPPPTQAPQGAGTPAPTPTRASSSLIPDFSGIQRAFNSAFDFGRLRDAFLLGAIGTVAIFTFIGLVLLLRRLL